MDLKLQPRFLEMLLRLLIYAVVASRIEALDITDVHIPSVVLNGSRDSVILDCNYRYEKFEATGLIVKWFWNSYPEPIYQWIPGEKPKALGILKNRIDPEHIASKDANARHRAIKLLRPTTELTGNYTCRISSFHDEEFTTRPMIVYADVQDMNLTFYVSEDSISFLCEASGGFPAPQMDIFTLSNGQREQLAPSSLLNVTIEDGSFHTTVEAVVDERKLRRETLVACLLRIPGTEYKIKREIIYFPIINGTEAENRSNFLWMLVLLIYLFHVGYE